MKNNQFKKEVFQSFLAILFLAFILFIASCDKEKCLPMVITPGDSSYSQFLTFNSLNPTVNTITLGQAKTNDIFTITNSDSKPHQVTLSFRLGDVAKQTIDSIYTTNDKSNFTYVPVIGDSIILNPTINASQMATISLRYKIKDTISNQNALGQSLGFTFSSFKSDESAKVNRPTSTSTFNLNQSLNLDALTFLTAVANNFDNYKIDSFVVGKSVAVGFRGDITNAGTAKIEFIGTLKNGSPAIESYWIKNESNTPLGDFNGDYVDKYDLGLISSRWDTFRKAEIAKIAVSTSTASATLMAGHNVIIFKTKALKNNIDLSSNIAQKVGLRITTANGKVYEMLYNVVDSGDLADKVVIQNSWRGGQNVPALTSYTDRNWNNFYIYPKNSDGSFVNNFPAIMSMGVSTEYYARTYPSLDFSNRGNEKFYSQAYTPNSVKVNILENFFYDKQKYFIKIYGNAFKMTLLNPNFQNIALPFYLNVYNGDNVNFPKPPTNSASLFPARGGWKFYGNPEMEIMVDNEKSQVVRLY